MIGGGNGVGSGLLLLIWSFIGEDGTGIAGVEGWSFGVSVEDLRGKSFWRVIWLECRVQCG